MVKPTFFRPVYPAYGRELMRRREAGEHPDPREAVLVALGFWPRPGWGRERWPRGRFVVVTDDMKIARLELRMLAGTVPIVACDKARVDRARELALQIAAVDPIEGVVYVLVYDVGLFACLHANGQWEDITESEKDYWVPLAADLSAMAKRGNDRSAA